jgi:hypothetical protein
MPRLGMRRYALSWFSDAWAVSRSLSLWIHSSVCVEFVEVDEINVNVICLRVIKMNSCSVCRYKRSKLILELTGASPHRVTLCLYSQQCRNRHRHLPKNWTHFLNRIATFLETQLCRFFKFLYGLSATSWHYSEEDPNCVDIEDS